MPEERTQSFQRNPALEELLARFSADIGPAEDILLSNYRNAPMRHPVILVMGPLRSGTTLFMQWLASLGLVAYPTNLLSRFFRAPVLGAEIQLLLTDPRYGFRDELSDLSKRIDFRSENGKTSGILAPNEFWYFWRRFLPEPRDVWTDDELKRDMDVETMRAELIGMMDLFDKPFAAKGLLFNYNIPFLNSVFERALFISIQRDLTNNVASVLDARKRQLGSESAWYSFKIPEHEELVHLDPIRQAAGQVISINRAVAAGMSKLPEARRLCIEYEEFCRAPARIFDAIISRLELPQQDYAGPAQFQENRVTVEARAATIRTAISDMESRFAAALPQRLSYAALPGSAALSHSKEI